MSPTQGPDATLPKAVAVLHQWMFPFLAFKVMRDTF